MLLKVVELKNMFAFLWIKIRVNGILLPKLFWPTVRKNFLADREKLLKFEAEGREFEITRIILVTRTIYSNSERLEQFLKRNPF